MNSYKLKIKGAPGQAGAGFPGWSGRHPVYLNKIDWMCPMQKHLDSDSSVLYIPIYSVTLLFCLVLLATTFLAVLGLFLSFKAMHSVLFPSCLYWCGLGCLVAMQNFIPIKSRSINCAIATTKHVRRYSVFLVFLATVVWGGAMLAAYLSGK